MIISHKNQYVFIEVPRTGTSAVSAELCSFYDGQRILRKHSSYWNFLAKRRQEWKDYQIFSSIRNPMDSIVSLYFKLKNSQKNPFQKSKSIGLGIGDSYFKEHYCFAQVNGNNFSDYFLKFYKRPYHDMTVSHDSMDFVMKFENLQQDFDQFLSMINIRKIRNLPIVNVTNRRSRDFWCYYEERTWERAFHVFGPYFKNWNYKFPDNWGSCRAMGCDELRWRLLNPFVKIAYFFFYLGNDKND